jgi:hypothetical protein
MNGNPKGVDERAFKRARKNSARIKELEGYNEALIRGREQAAKTAVKDIEDWIFIVQSRTRAIDILRKVLLPEAVELLAEIDAREAK